MEAKKGESCLGRPDTQAIIANNGLPTWQSQRK